MCHAYSHRNVVTTTRMKILLASPRAVLRRREHGDRKPGPGDPAVRHADLRLSRDRPQQVRRRDVSRARGRVRRSPGRSARPGRTLLFSAHGVSPEIRRVARERKLRAIDATCPLVTKVHLEAIRFAKRRLHDRAHRPRRARRSRSARWAKPRRRSCWSNRPRTSIGSNCRPTPSWPT